MQTLDALARRIQTTESLRSIVRTMKSLSQVSIHQYEVAASTIADYHRTIALGLQIALRSRPPARPSKPAKPERVAILIFGSDHGLCGRFNDQVVDFALRRLEEDGVSAESRLWLAVGARVEARLAAQGQATSASYVLPGSVSGLADIVGTILVTLDEWREEDRFDRAVVFHNHRDELAAPAARVQRVWPVDSRYLRALAHQPWESRSLPIFTMDQEALLSALIRQHLFVTIFRAGAESLSAEHAARLASMQAAERNIVERLQEMNADYRRERQNAITAELLDIVNGYEATSV